MWQQGWSSEPCDMHKYRTCASYLAHLPHPCSCFCVSNVSMRHYVKLLFMIKFSISFRMRMIETDCGTMWQQGWSSEPCDMHKYESCASYLARSHRPCGCLCVFNVSMRHKSNYFSWLLLYFSWYVCWLSSICRRLINLLNYEHRKCLTTIRSPSATIVTTTRVDATILCWTKEDTSPSRLGGASKIVRYATSTTCSSYLSMHDLSFCFNVSFFL